MVKFGRHLDAFLAENQGSNLYVVPYSKIRDQYVENVPASEASDTIFEAEWLSCLEKATSDFDRAMSSLWETVFEGLDGRNSNDNEYRGATPDKAFRMYLSFASTEESQELLALVSSIFETSLTNAEALRKLVKKVDKQHHAKLSRNLLPKLYAANFVVGQPTLEDGLTMLRDRLEEEDEEEVMESSSSRSLTASRSRRGHDVTVERRREELAWLKHMTHSLPPSELCHIVAHRGFHNPTGRSDKRPLENSLAAYEAAWTNGIHLCECDVALTKDEKLVLAHDEDFSRLALDWDSPSYDMKVRDLSFRELISLPLKSGIRPPLLIDVLRSARAIGGNSQLIIEIKPGNNDAAKALGRLFLRHPDLMEQCAVIMSFDLFAMHSLRDDLAAVLQPPTGDGGGARRTHKSSMSLGTFGHFVDPSAEGFVPLEPRRDSFDHYGVGLTLSDRAESLTRMNDGGSFLRSDKFAERKRRVPKLMLLTVSDKPKIPCELQVDVSELEKVDQWLHRKDGSLDGVYVQFQMEMLQKEGTQKLRQLANKCTVGVWNFAHKDPDNYETVHHLIREGRVSFVNSDLPKGFKKNDVQRRASSLGI